MVILPARRKLIMLKKLFVIIGIAFSISAQANTIDTVFKKDSALPQELQKRVLQYVNTNCANLVSYSGLQELATDVREVKIDQGMVDQYFTTTFASSYRFDGQHSVRTYITVESAQYAFSNGDNLAVLSIESNDDCRAQ